MDAHGQVLPYDDFVRRVLRRKRLTDGQRAGLYLYDSIRRKWMLSTPEELVRQYTIHRLVASGYPKGRIGVEKRFRRGDIIFAVDIIIYGRDGNPHTVVECKRGDVPLSGGDLLQASFYRKHLNARCVAISNGRRHICYEWDACNGKWRYHRRLPKGVA